MFENFFPTLSCAHTFTRFFHRVNSCVYMDRWLLPPSGEKRVRGAPLGAPNRVSFRSKQSGGSARVEIVFIQKVVPVNGIVNDGVFGVDVQAYDDKFAR